MPVLLPVTIPPFPASSASMTSVIQEWNRGVARANDEASKANVAIATARRGGVELANDARSIGANSAEVVRGVAAANPRAESALASRAVSNKAGVNRAIIDAERNAGDPTAPTPRPNFGAAEAQVAGKAGGIRAGARGIDRRAGQGDALERRI